MSVCDPISFGYMTDIVINNDRNDKLQILISKPEKDEIPIYKTTMTYKKNDSNNRLHIQWLNPTYAFR